MFHHAAVALDLSPASETVLIGIPDLLRLGVKQLTLIHVTALDRPTDEEIERCRKALEYHRPELERTGFAFEVVIRTGMRVEAILDATEKAGADLLVIGSHGMQSALNRVFLGDTAAELLRRAPLPVLVERMGPGSEEQRVSCVNRFSTLLLASDCDSTASAAEQVALELAGEVEQFHLLGVVDNGDAAAIESHLRELAAPFGEKASWHIEHGTPSAAIMRLANALACSLIVIGKHDGCDNHGRPPGTTTATLVRNAQHAVLVVPPALCTTP